MTLPREMTTWFLKTGYRSVVKDCELWRLFTKASRTLIDKVNELYQHGYRVCLLVNHQLMHYSTQSNSSQFARHWVVLTSRITTSPSVSFAVYSWGDGRHVILHPHWTRAGAGLVKQLSLADLREHLFGVVAGKL